MRKKREIVNTITEVVLASVLLGIFAFTFAVIWSLNPVPSNKQAVVLGTQVSSLPFELLESGLFEQTKYIGSENNFEASYSFAVSHINPEQVYELMKLSNNTNEERKFAISVVIPEEVIKYYKVAGIVADKEYLIYDYFEDEQVYDLVVSLKPNTESLFKLYVKTYSEEAPSQLDTVIKLEVLQD